MLTMKQINERSKDILNIAIDIASNAETWHARFYAAWTISHAARARETSNTIQYLESHMVKTCEEIARDHFDYAEKDLLSAIKFG